MNNNDNKPLSTETGKAAPTNVSADTEAQAKEKTQPIGGENANLEDQDEGNMDNGEIGAGLRKT